MKNASKTKGSAFERKIANLLSARFAAHTGLTQAFRRSPDSGAYFGGVNSIRSSTHDLRRAVMGDIITPEGFAFSIECKHYREPPSLGSILAKKNAVLDRWIAQATQDAMTSGLMPVILAKWDRVPEVAMVPLDDDAGEGVVNYRGWAILPITDWLERPDGYFFV